MVVSVDGETVPADAQGVVHLARFSTHEQVLLLRGDVLIVPQSHPKEPAAVMAHIYVPLDRSHLWPQITSYRRWTQYFPNIIHSEVLESVKTAGQRYRRLYQVGQKGFMMMTAQVEIYLQVLETTCEHIQFRLERGTFSYFAADLHLQDMGEGTLLTYRVQAAPTIPVPTFLIEQGMKIDLPGNMRQMRQVLCQGYGVV